MEPQTIGIRGSGPGAGKDAVADIICAALEERKLAPRRERFATPLRECIEVLTGVPVAETETTEGKNRFLPAWDMTVGQMLQRLGTDAIRLNFHPDAWVLSLFRRFGDDDLVVISDVRFPNEAAAVRTRRGIIIHVERDAGGAPDTALAGRDPNHLSERAFDGAAAHLGGDPGAIDFVIKNDGTLAELEAKTRHLVDTLFG